MSRWCIGLVAPVGLFIVSSSSLQAQDGRGSHGGSPRSGMYINPSSYSYSSGYRYLYPSGYIVPVQGSSATPVPAPSTPATPAQPAVVGMKLAPANGTASAQSGAAASSTSSPSSSAKITVMVPDGALVWFDGTQSDKKEGTRAFTSGPIESGRTIHVSVKISWAGNTREMQLGMQSGDAMTIDLRGSQ